MFKKRGGIVLALGIIGAAFFFGDAMITPAMTVLGAVEGLKVINPSSHPYVVPMTLAILVIAVHIAVPWHRRRSPRCSRPSPRFGSR